EWKEPVYTYNFPAHWSYEQMKGAYKNYRAFVRIDNASGGKFRLTDGLVGGQIPDGLFQNGDILVNNNNQEFYLSDLDKAANTFSLKSRNNTLPSISPAYYTIIQSGYKNLQSTKKGKIVSLEDPTDLKDNVTPTNGVNAFMSNFNNH